MTTIAADVLVGCLLAQGVDRIFCVPGESYLPVLDALHRAGQGDGAIDVVTCRHEGGAGYMAVTDAKLTGRPGVCFVSRGPGATNVSIAVHTAEQDAAPLVLFVGQVARADLGRGAFQEVDYEKTFSDMAKWVRTVHSADALPETIARAFQVARAGTPGPVVVVLPEDMLEDLTDREPMGTQPVAAVRPTPADLDSVAAMLNEAERPLLIAGGAVAGARENLLAAAETWTLPVAATFKRQDLFPNRHPLFGGYLGFNIPRPQVELMQRADLILAVGTRLGDVSTQGYVLPAFPKPLQPLIHVYADPGVVGRVYPADLGLACDGAALLRALAERRPNTVPEARREWAERLHAHAVGLAAWEPANPEDGVDFGRIVMALTERLSGNAVLVTDAGNFSSWVHRLFPFGPNHLLLGAVSGAMGMAVPAAVAAGLRLPGRQVVTFVGDGGMLMTGNELATAVRRRIPVRIFVSNNRSYGTIRLHQEKRFPGHVMATDLTNPDFAAYGEAFGAKGLRIDGEGDVDAAVVAAALDHAGPVVVDVRSSLEQISAYVSLSQLKGLAQS